MRTLSHGRGCIWSSVELLPQTVPPRPLALGDVQNVLLWALTADAGEMPKWLCVRNKPLIRGAIFILAPTLGADQIDAIGTGFTKPRTVSLPRAHHSRAAQAVADELLQVKVARKRKAAALEAEPPAAEPSGSGDSTQAEHPGRLPGGAWRLSYVRSFGLSRSELRENKYPLHGTEATSGFEPLRAGSADVDAAARLVAIDCEMVLVRADHMVDGGWPLVKQLARVALVDASGNTLLDELVKPDRPVIDYLTRYSGITEEILEGASYTFNEVRAKVTTILDGCVLVGHSLECDLEALKLSVPLPPKQSTGDDAPLLPCILDTALLYPLRCNHSGPPAKCALRNLTVNHLKREIQQPPPQSQPSQPHQHGHNPTEDATVAMDLALLKLARGHAYGIPGAAWGAGYEPLKETLERNDWKLFDSSNLCRCPEDRQLVFVTLDPLYNDQLKPLVCKLPANTLIAIVGMSKPPDNAHTCNGGAVEVEEEEEEADKAAEPTEPKPARKTKTPPGWVAFAVSSGPTT